MNIKEIKQVVTYDEFWTNKEVHNETMHKLFKIDKLMYIIFLSFVTFGLTSYFAFYIPQMFDKTVLIFIKSQSGNTGVSLIFAFYSFYIFCFALSVQGLFYGLLLVVYCQSVALKNEIDQITFESQNEEERYKQLVNFIQYYSKIIW